MNGLIFDRAQIEEQIDQIVKRTMRMDMTWDWPCGCLLYTSCLAFFSRVIKSSASLMKITWSGLL